MGWNSGPVGVAARHTDVKQLRAPDMKQHDSSVGQPAAFVLREDLGGHRDSVEFSFARVLPTLASSREALRAN